jgi:hypothetical protein
MSKPPEESSRFDPLSFWGANGALSESWSKAMTDLAGSESSFEGSTRALDSYLAATASAHKLFTQFMSQVLGQLNMPTQGEITSMAARLTNIEMRLDDLDARLDDIVRAVETLAGARPQANGPDERPEVLKGSQRTAASSRRRDAGEKQAGVPTRGRSRTLQE